MEGQREIAPPVPTPGTEPFWQAAAAGTLLIGHCTACGQAHYYPRHHCPFCYSGAVDWRPASGHGEIYALSVLRRTSIPYAIAYVRLDEGPAMLTNILAPSLDALRIGDRVQVSFQPAGDGSVPLFVPEEVAP